ncbi:hypothetical protein FACS1894170_05320 [Planctomycetales bacterium]|nr:hypothetical protein FACS1894170_05320 [Planctomycetales bacterium]
MVASTKIKVFVVFWLCGFVPNLALAGESDVERLRLFSDRGLYDAAEALYIEKTQQDGISDKDKTVLAKELARIRASQGEKKLLAGQLTEAATSYQRAATLLSADDDMAYRYRRNAVSILAKELQKRGGNTEPVRRQLIDGLRKLAVDYPKHKNSEALHLAAIDQSGELIKPDTQNDAPLKDDLLMLSLLQEHLRLWSTSPKTQMLRTRTVTLLEQLGRMNDAAAMIERLDTAGREALPPSVQLSYSKYLTENGRQAEAVALVRKLSEQTQRKNTLVQQAFAETLGKSTDSVSLEEALGIWLSLEQQTTKQSAGWKTARTGVIETLIKLGRRGEAEKLQEITKILYETELPVDNNGKLEKIRED